MPWWCSSKNHAGSKFSDNRSPEPSGNNSLSSFSGNFLRSHNGNRIAYVIIVAGSTETAGRGVLHILVSFDGQSQRIVQLEYGDRAVLPAPVQRRFFHPDRALLERPDRLVITAKLHRTRAGTARFRGHDNLAPTLARAGPSDDLVRRFPLGRQQTFAVAYFQTYTHETDDEINTGVEILHARTDWQWIILLDRSLGLTPKCSPLIVTLVPGGPSFGEIPVTTGLLAIGTR